MNSLKPFDKNKVILGFSGGVDSTVAAFLLKKKGYEVIGFYFNVTEKKVEENIAKKIASQLGIRLIIKNVKDNFDNIVIRDFCKQYVGGKTPNPCVLCNPTIKFKELIETANENDAHYIATGHYANVVLDYNNKTYYIHKGANEKKDQSYMLYRLGQDILSRLILPLGDFADKEEVREIAKTCNLSNAEKKDSQELCFIDQNAESHTDFIKRQGYSCNKGNFLNTDGDIIGEHKGLMHYTIGQRKGLGITLGKPAFVIRIDERKNSIVLGDEDDLYTDLVSVQDCFFTRSGESKEVSSIFPREYDKMQVTAKVRYSAQVSSGVLISDESGSFKIKFDNSQRAITPGQSIVIYIEDKLLGGGIITMI